MTSSYRLDSIWTSKHQMQINGKRDNLTIEDMRACARNINISGKRIGEILRNVIGVVKN